MRYILLPTALILFTSCSTINNYFELKNNDQHKAVTDKTCRLVKHYKKAKYCVYQREKQLTAWNSKDKARLFLSGLKSREICP